MRSNYIIRMKLKDILSELQAIQMKYFGKWRVFISLCEESISFFVQKDNGESNTFVFFDFTDNEKEYNNMKLWINQ